MNSLKSLNAHIGSYVFNLVHVHTLLCKVLLCASYLLVFTYYYKQNDKPVIHFISFNHFNNIGSIKF